MTEDQRIIINGQIAVMDRALTKLQNIWPTVKFTDDEHGAASIGRQLQRIENRIVKLAYQATKELT